jgi:hypothetical protein
MCIKDRMVDRKDRSRRQDKNVNAVWTPRHALRRDEMLTAIVIERIGCSIVVQICGIDRLLEGAAASGTNLVFEAGDEDDGTGLRCGRLLKNAEHEQHNHGSNPSDSLDRSGDSLSH